METDLLKVLELRGRVNRVSAVVEIFNRYVYVAGGDAASSLLDELARFLHISWQRIPDFDRTTIVPGARKACFIAEHLKTLDNPLVIKAAEAIGMTVEDIRQLEAVLKER